MSIDVVEFGAIALIHFFAVASPGPDFTIILKQSIEQGRSAALWTSMGIGCGILLHVAYSLLGISLLIKTTPWLFSFLLYAAAAYLCYIGIQALNSKASTQVHEHNTKTSISGFSQFRAFTLGFVTNGLNPKATLFFLSVFTVVISQETTFQTKVMYGVYMSITTAIWFSMIACVISRPNIRAFYINKAYIFDKLMGAVLITMAIMLVLYP